MLRSLFIALALGASALTSITPILSKTTVSVTNSVDPKNLKLAEQIVTKLIPLGIHEKMMNDIVSRPMMDQILSMNTDKFGSNKGENLAEIGTKNDPYFKERFDITMKIMTSEIGKAMTKIEPKMRATLAKVYVKKYNATQLTDILNFLSTRSGSTFANDYMISFIEPEMLEFSFAMMPTRMEEFPAIMKKIEAATAHLPSPTKLVSSNDESYAVSKIAKMLDAIEGLSIKKDSVAPDETGEEPWYDETNWTPAQRNTFKKINDAYAEIYIKSNAIYDKGTAAEKEAIDLSRKRFLAEGWKSVTPDIYEGATASPAEGPPPQKARQEQQQDPNNGATI